MSCGWRVLFWPFLLLHRFTAALPVSLLLVLYNTKKFGKSFGYLPFLIGKLW